jgi:hypothetical protein
VAEGIDLAHVRLAALVASLSPGVDLGYMTSLNGPQDLRLITDAPVPSPGAGEVLIRVTAAGVSFVDISQARGTFAGGPQPPCVAGIEGAGEVIAVGEGVTNLEPGAHVIGADHVIDSRGADHPRRGHREPPASLTAPRSNPSPTPDRRASLRSRRDPWRERPYPFHHASRSARV